MAASGFPKTPIASDSEPQGKQMTNLNPQVDCWRDGTRLNPAVNGLGRMLSATTSIGDVRRYRGLRYSELDLQGVVAAGGWNDP